MVWRKYPEDNPGASGSNRRVAQAFIDANSAAIFRKPFRQGGLGRRHFFVARAIGKIRKHAGAFTESPESICSRFFPRDALDAGAHEFAGPLASNCKVASSPDVIHQSRTYPACSEKFLTPLRRWIGLGLCRPRCGLRLRWGGRGQLHLRRARRRSYFRMVL